MRRFTRFGRERSANAFVRVPPAERPRHIEMRSPDPACNPYLALSVLIGSALDGVDRAHAAGTRVCRFDVRPYRTRPPRARHRHVAEVVTASHHRIRRRRGRARDARRSSLSRVPRCQARRIRTIPPRRPLVGAPRVPASVLRRNASRLAFNRREQIRE